MGIATSLEATIDSALRAFVSQKSAALCGAIAPVALTAITIYVMMMGYAIARGEVQDSLNMFIKKVFKITIITSIALGGGAYQTYIIDFVYGIQGLLISTFYGSGTDTIGKIVDDSATPVLELGFNYMKIAIKGTIPAIVPLTQGIGAILLFLIMNVIAVGVYLMSLVALAIALAIGPIYILLAAFPATQKFTESWVGVTLGFAVTNGLLAACLSMFGTLVAQMATKIAAAPDAEDAIQKMSALGVCIIVLCLIIWNIKTIASALTGGIGLEGVGNMVAHTALRGLQNLTSSGKSKSPSSGNSSGGEIGKGGAGPGASGQAGSGWGAGSNAPRQIAAQRYVMNTLNKQA